MNRNKIADAVIKMSIEIEKIADKFSELFDADELFRDIILDSKWEIFEEITATEEEQYNCVDCCYDLEKMDNEAWLMSKAYIMDNIKDNINKDRIDRIASWTTGSDIFNSKLRKQIYDIYEECKRTIIEAADESEE